MVRLLAILAFAFPVVSAAHDLAPLHEPELASVLGLLEELAITPVGSSQPYIVRVYAAPTVVGECGGTVVSCPDVRLFITVANGDLGETPVLYQLPLQKGWQFKAWSQPLTVAGTPMASFVVRTALPSANIDPANRKDWRAVEYRVLVSPTSASFAAH